MDNKKLKFFSTLQYVEQVYKMHRLFSISCDVTERLKYPQAWQLSLNVAIAGKWQ